MSEAQFKYRCRRCRDLFTEGVIGAERAEFALTQAMLGRKNAAQVPRMLTLHQCDPDRRGVADLVGCVVYRGAGED